MSSPQYPYPPPQGYGPPPPHGPNKPLALAGAGAIVALLGNAFVYYQVHDLREAVTHGEGVMQSQIDTIKENSTVMTAAQKKHLDDLRQDLDSRARQLSQAASQAQTQAKNALSYADQQSQKLEKENQQTKQAVDQTNSALSDVKQRADTANAKLADVGTDVQGVKTDLAGTKTDLEKTKSDLKKVSGDLGVTNGYVATNAKELDELKRRGEVSIVEFSLHKKKEMQKVGDISLLLEKSDPKKNRFNVIVLADDKRVEKKDRTVNEPLQFYVSKSLYQVVVLSVAKDQISGYLQTPKYQSR